MATSRTGAHLCALVTWLGILHSLPCSAQSKQLPPHTRLVVRSIGGFLGQIEGFCEDPGGPYDEQTTQVKPPACDGGTDKPWPAWLGGALGAVKWQAATRRTDATTWLVIAPNNQTPDFSDARATLAAGAEKKAATAKEQAIQAQAVRRVDFWDQIRALQPDVVALGPGDFLRSLAASTSGDQMPPAPAFIKWLQHSGIPFVASNVAIRFQSKQPAIRKGGPYQLHVDSNTSISWLDTLKLETPCLPEPSITLIETAPNGGEPTENIAQGFVADGSTCTGTVAVDRAIALRRPLRPGRKYELHVDAYTFTFRTDAAIATFDGESFAAKEDGTVAIGLVDPGVGRRLTDQVRRWTDRDDCPETTCELVFLDPVKTTKSVIAARLAAIGRTPVVILASALDDGGTLDVLNAAPEVRIVVLQAESLLLGRAASAKGGYSGDLGMAAIVDGEQPMATRILMRPEWFGETAGEAEADVAWCSSARCVTALDDERASVTLVNGAEFISTPVAGRVRYSAKLGAATSDEVFLGDYPAYTNCDAKTRDRTCEAYVESWSNATLPVVIADSIRRSADAELAIVPTEIVDSSYVDWIKKEVARRESAA